MIKGICDTDKYSPLEKGQEYYLFPCGEYHYYVSKFNSPTAHYGVYEKKNFTVLIKQEPGQLSLF